MTDKPSTELGANRLRRAFMQSVGVIGVGLLVAFLWLGAIREPLSLAESASKLAQVAVDGRAHIIALYVADLEERVEQLADSIDPYTSATALVPEAVGFPDAAAVSYIPLGDLGTVRINPGDHGLRSHIDIDIVRRAFAGEEPPPESIATTETTYTIFARGAGDPLEGVVLVEMTNDRLSKLVSESEEGQYQLIQRQSNGDALRVAGAVQSAPSASARVGGSLWSLEFQPDEQWLGDVQPAWWSLVGAMLIAFSTFGLGAYWLFSRPSKLLSDEASQIIAQAGQGLSVTVNTPPLLPLAKSLVDLNSLTKRQLAALKISPPTAPAGGGSAQSSPEEAVEAAEKLESPPESKSEVSGMSATREKHDGIPEHVFEDTGIRGRAQSELSSTLIEQIGHAIAVICADKGISALLIARDGKPSSDLIRTQLTKTLAGGGVDILDLEEAPLPLLQFATHTTNADSGIMITADPDDEGISRLQVIFNQTVVTGEGIEQILSVIRTGTRKSGSGRVAKQPIAMAYKEKVVSDVSLALPLKVVVGQVPDAVGAVATSLIEQLGCDVVRAEPAPGNTESARTSREQTLNRLGQAVIDAGADLGVQLDSQAGRLFTVTNEGSPVHTDQLLMILAQDILERNPGADVIYDVNFTRHFAPFITRCGGRAQMARSGGTFVGEKLLQTGALIAATFSGHLFFKDRWFGFDDALYATARLLEVLSSQSQSYQELVSALPVAVSTPEILIPLDSANRKKAMRALIGHPEFPGARITTLDGLRVDYADGWGVIRNAPNDGALVVRLEGNDNASLSRIKGLLQKALSEAVPELTISL